MLKRTALWSCNKMSLATSKSRPWMEQSHFYGPALLPVNEGIKFNLDPKTFAKTTCNMVVAKAAVAKPRSQTWGLYTHSATKHSSFVRHFCLAPAKRDKALLAKRQTGQYITHLLRESLQGHEGPNFVEPYLTGTAMEPNFAASSTSSRRALK